MVTSQPTPEPLSESHGINTLSCLGGHTGELTLAKYPESGAAQLARHQVLLMEQQLLKQLVEVWVVAISQESCYA
jgi:hypothetical protein